MSTMDMTTLANPFHVWGELARGLRDRIIAEMGDINVSPVAGDLLSTLVVLSRRCDDLGEKLARLREQDAPAYDAFLRALEKS